MLSGGSRTPGTYGTASKDSWVRVPDERVIDYSEFIDETVSTEHILSRLQEWLSSLFLKCTFQPEWDEKGVVTLLDFTRLMVTKVSVAWVTKPNRNTKSGVSTVLVESPPSLWISRRWVYKSKLTKFFYSETLHFIIGERVVIWWRLFLVKWTSVPRQVFSWVSKTQGVTKLVHRKWCTSKNL